MALGHLWLSKAGTDKLCLDVRTGYKSQVKKWLCVSKLVRYAQSGYKVPAELTVALWIKTLSFPISSVKRIFIERPGNLKLSAIISFQHNSWGFTCIGHPTLVEKQFRSTRQLSLWGRTRDQRNLWPCLRHPSWRPGAESSEKSADVSAMAGQSDASLTAEEWQLPLSHSVTRFSYPARPGLQSAPLSSQTRV